LACPTDTSLDVSPRPLSPPAEPDSCKPEQSGVSAVSTKAEALEDEGEDDDRDEEEMDADEVTVEEDERSFHCCHSSLEHEQLEDLSDAELPVDDMALDNAGARGATFDDCADDDALKMALVATAELARLLLARVLLLATLPPNALLLPGALALETVGAGDEPGESAETTFEYSQMQGLRLKAAWHCGAAAGTMRWQTLAQY